VGVVRVWRHSREVNWARTVAVPSASRLFDEGKTGEAYALAEKAETLIG
jgi:hypothetical protein